MGKVTALRPAAKKDPEDNDKDQPERICHFSLDEMFCAIKEACVACGHGSEKRTIKKIDFMIVNENLIHMVDDQHSNSIFVTIILTILRTEDLCSNRMLWLSLNYINKV